MSEDQLLGLAAAAAHNVVVGTGQQLDEERAAFEIACLFRPWLVGKLRFPSELTDDLAEILGRPNFSCATLAALLRMEGHSIKERAEAEQAAVIYWLVRCMLEHGDEWREVAQLEFNRMLKLQLAVAPKG